MLAAAGLLCGQNVRGAGSKTDPKRAQRAYAAGLDAASHGKTAEAFEAFTTAILYGPELADAYRKHGLTREDFERRFTRLAVLRAASDAGTVDDTLRWRR